MEDDAPVETAIAEAEARRDLPTVNDVPETIDPFKDGMLMAHQLDWIEDKAPLKIAEKCRRSGFTFAEALDDTITAATARGEGGSNVFYIGDTQEKGREFIAYCAAFARGVAGWDGAVEEFLFKDQNPDTGETREISAFRIQFASGYRIAALSSRPENIRGLQGVVVIDEAAFHRDVGEVIDAAIALLIWGGRIRIISTHNGKLNPFNELVTRTQAGKTNYSLHRITFEGVIANGLYDRVKAINPDVPPLEKWAATIREAYVDEARMREELDAIPRDAEGSALSRVQVEACKDAAIPVLRLAKKDEFKLASELARAAEIAAWIREHLKPIMDGIDINRRTVIGGDIARRGHGAVFWIAQIGAGLRREAVAVLELRNLPFANMRQILFYVLANAGRRWRASLDASGLGMQMAEEAALKFGPRVSEETFSIDWYRTHGAALVTSVEDEAMTVPADDDIITDICALAWINGVVKIPDKHETIGADGGKRHADAAIAAMLMEAAATEEPPNVDEIAAGGERDAAVSEWSGALDQTGPSIIGVGLGFEGGGGFASGPVDYLGWGEE